MVCSVQELTEEVSRVMGVELRVEYLRERAEVEHAYASREKV